MYTHAEQFVTLNGAARYRISRPNDWATDLQGKIVNNLQCDMCNQLKINTLILNINPLPSWTKHQDICTEGPSFTVQLWYPLVHFYPCSVGRGIQQSLPGSL